jgi:hypothetical protein
MLRSITGLAAVPAPMEGGEEMPVETTTDHEASEAEIVTTPDALVEIEWMSKIPEPSVQTRVGTALTDPANAMVATATIEYFKRFFIFVLFCLTVNCVWFVFS